ERTRELRKPGGAADRLQDQVCRGVVAPINRRGAEIGKRHASLCDMRFRDWRIVEQVAWPIGDDPVEALGALVHALERRGRGQKLERAAHWEPLVGAMLDRCAGPR